MTPLQAIRRPKKKKKVVDPTNDSLGTAPLEAMLPESAPVIAPEDVMQQKEV